MIINLAAAALLIPLTALMLAACVWAKADEQLTEQLQQARRNRPRSRYGACVQSIARDGEVK